jgi:isoleucyl-tRNA synthetase
MNKCLEGFHRQVAHHVGFDAPYVPGWDCHGLPIEIKVDKELGGKKLEMHPLTCAPSAASMRRSSSTCSASSSSASASSAASTSLTPP